MTKLFSLGLTLLALILFVWGCGSTDDPLGAAGRRLSPVDSAPAVTTFASPSETVIIMAGKTMNIGTLRCSLDGTNLVLDYQLVDGWMMAKTDLAISETYPGSFPLTRKGNPIIGHFPFKTYYDPPVTSAQEMVDLAAMDLTDANEIEVAMHAEVVLPGKDGSILQSEGAWAQGPKFRLMDGNRVQIKMEPGNWSMYFHLDLRRLRGLLLWNKLGSAYEVTHSEVGPDGEINGSIGFFPGKYGNGFRPAPRTGDHNIPSNFIDFPGLDLGDKGCIEFWYQPDWNDWRVGHVVGQFAYGVPAPPHQNGSPIRVGFNDWQNLFELSVWNDEGANGAANRAAIQLVPASTPEWSTAHPFHMAFTWDGTDADVTNRIHVYFDGNPVGNLWYVGNPVFDNFPLNSILRMGCRLNEGDWDRHHWEGSDGVIDNLKVWSFPKTDFSDRFSE